VEITVAAATITTTGYMKINDLNDILYRLMLVSAICITSS
jgi:hypothetical protein